MARNFSKEFKIHAVKLVKEKDTKIANVAQMLDIKVQVLYRWVNEYAELGEDAFVGKGHLSPQDKEIRKLKKQIEELKTENLILKKAQAYFAKTKAQD